MVSDIGLGRRRSLRFAKLERERERERENGDQE